MLLLGVDLTRCTYFHCLEEVAGLGEIWSLSAPSGPRYLIRADGSVVEVVSRGHKDYKSDNYGRAEAELIAAGVVPRPCSGRRRCCWSMPRRRPTIWFLAFARTRSSSGRARHCAVA